MSDTVLVALIISIAPTLGAIISVWRIIHTKITPTLMHIERLTNSTLTTAIQRIEELEKEIRELKQKVTL